MQGLESVRKLEVKIHKTRKWAINGLKILLDPSDSIASQYKKKFAADVTVHYRFGVCTYAARVRQNGDYKDHIIYAQGNIYQSLDVKLENGNIASAVKFKLFLPGTRNSRVEVIGTRIMRELGFIAPRTALFTVSVNRLQAGFLFQEKEAKELLEGLHRREGPIFEGDETLLWSYPGYRDLQLTSVSAARLVNGKWAAGGKTSSKIALEALKVLQTAYMRASSNPEISFFFDPNSDENPEDTYPDFQAFLLAFNGFHGLRAHNGKSYWNALSDQFEPIYYDGNLSRSEITGKNFAGPWNKKDDKYFLHNMRDADFEGLIRKISALDRDGFIAEYAILSQLPLNEAAAEVRATASSLVQNLETLEVHVAKARKVASFQPLTNDAITARRIFINRSMSFGVNQFVAEVTHQSSDDNYTLNCVAQFDCAYDDVTIEEMAELMETGDLRGQRIILSGMTPLADENIEVADVLSVQVSHAAGARVSYDAEKSQISLFQNRSDDWFLIRNADLAGIQIVLHGADPGKTNGANRQRFNSLGLTGCLTLYKVALEGTAIAVRGGECEDSVNIVASSGSLSEIDVRDAYSDAVDLDFSNLHIDRMHIDRSGNDCLDVSGGEYDIGDAQLLRCGDKGISVGEASTLNAASTTVVDAGKGVASKDFSSVALQDFIATGTATCLEAFQKKSEFGGALIAIENGECNGGQKFFDGNSQISMNGVVLELSD